MEKKPFTKKQILGHLEKLNKRWNNRYWIFATDGGLVLMKMGKDGDRIVSPGGGMSREAIVRAFNGINADGGDW